MISDYIYADENILRDLDSGRPSQSSSKYAAIEIRKLRKALLGFVNYYAGEKALQLGNGQARKSLDEFRALLGIHFT